MSDSRSQVLNSRTVVFGADDFQFETLEQNNGVATIIKFKLDEDDCNAGDVLVVLSGTDIHFHGLIGKIDEEGWAIASDPRGSLLPATTQ
jgi:hypothetical protein